MSAIDDTIACIGQLDAAAMVAARRAAGTAIPCPLRRRAVMVLAADHGVTAQCVSAYPSAVTAQMVRNCAAGGAAINALAHTVGARVVVADLGVAADLDEVPGLRRCPVAPGTADMALGPAMSRVQAVQAMDAGITLVHERQRESWRTGAG